MGKETINDTIGNKCECEEKKEQSRKENGLISVFGLFCVLLFAPPPSFCFSLSVTLVSIIQSGVDRVDMSLCVVVGVYRRWVLWFHFLSRTSYTDMLGTRHVRSEAGETQSSLVVGRTGLLTP